MPHEPAFRLSFPSPDIGLLTFDRPDMSANVLSQHVLEEFAGHLSALEKRNDLAGLIIASGKPGIFIAGADLREFLATLGAPREAIVGVARQGQELFAWLSRAPFVTVAAIDGICVGGGAELAVWCDRRIMTNSSKTEFGFPEVKLGLFPGWGGTARLPRIVGIGNAVEMITSGESISPADALKMGLVSDVVSADKLQEAAINLIRLEKQTGAYLADRQLWQGPLPISETELGFLGATASAFIRGQTKGNYPAPEAALEVLLAAATADAASACQMEAEGFAPLFGSPVNRALLNVFFLTDRNKKDKGVDADDVPTRKIERTGVIGAGIMGAGIAAANVKRDLPVSLTDADADSLARGMQGVIQEVAYNRQTKKPDAERAIHYAPLLSEARDVKALAGCDLVIEAVVENMDVKRRVYSQLEPLLPDSAILASNTSTIPITKLAKDLARPEQFVGIHFFNPVRMMKLVEIIRGEKTSDATIATAVAYAKRVGKMPIVVGDGPGFLVNRLLFPYMSEAVVLLLEGVSIKDIERAALKFGMPVGPLELHDMVGIDTAIYCGATIYEAFPSRVVLAPVLPALKKAGRLGQKNGKGFFSYQNKKGKAEPDAEVQAILDNYVRTTKSYSVDELQQRLFLPMLIEATRVLEEHKVRDVRDVDTGVIFGLGFPPFKGGLLFWADTLGAKQILDMAKPWEHLGERFAPTPLLRRMAEEGTTFYANDKD